MQLSARQINYNRKTKKDHLGFYVTNQKWQFLLEKSYTTIFPPAHNHIRSKNNFIKKTFPNLVSQRPVLVLSDYDRTLHVIHKDNIIFEKPHNIEYDQDSENLRPCYPDECIKRSLIYGGNVYIDNIHKVYRLPPEEVEDPRFVFDSQKAKTSVSPNVDYSDLELMSETRYNHTHFTVFPTMIGTCADRIADESSVLTLPENRAYMAGVYIAHGLCRIIQPILNRRLNYPLISRNSQSLNCEIRCRCTDKYRGTSNLNLQITSKDAIKASFNQLSYKKTMDLMIIFRLLGINDAETAEACVFPEEVRYNPEHEEYGCLQKFRRSLFHEYQKMSNAQIYHILGCDISKEKSEEKYRKDGCHSKSNELLPHIGLDNLPLTRLKKAIFLGIAIRNMLKVDEGLIEEDDRDSPVHKILELAGERLAVLVKREMDKVNKNLRDSLISKAKAGENFDDILTNIRNSQNIIKTIITAIKTGIWASPEATKSDYGQTGVTKIVETDNLISQYSFLNMITSSVTKQQKDTQVRQLKPENEFMSCPVENPEGDKCGVNEHLPYLAHVRIGIETKRVIEMLNILFDFQDVQCTSSVEEYLQTEDGQDPYYQNLLSIHNENIHGPQADCPLKAEDFIHSKNRVFVDGLIIGIAYDGFVEELREARRSKQLPWQISIVSNSDGIWIWCSDGCILNPTIVLENLHKLPKVLFDLAVELNLVHRSQVFDDDLLDICLEDNQFLNKFWMHCIYKGIIEYQSKEEELNSSTIAEVRTLRILINQMENLNNVQKKILLGRFFDKYTHIRVDDCQIFSICSALIPFPDYNQSPRNMYQSNMCKASIMSIHPLLQERIDGHMRQLWNAQKAIARTRQELLFNFDAYPCGINAIVAIICNAYNMEDSLIMNRASNDRGIFRIFSIIVVHSIQKKSTSDKERFQNPKLLPKCLEMRDANYDKLDADGLIGVGCIVQKGDVIIGKVTELTEINSVHDKIVYCDRSKIYTEDEPAVVQKIIVTVNKDGLPVRKVVLRSMRNIQIGDKFASRAGQKGTVSLLFNPEDGPQTVKDGIIPDIVMNVHGYPGRMTNAQLMESLSSKAACLSGEFVDATAFEQNQMEKYMSILGHHGYEKFGNEMMINGKTGELFGKRIDEYTVEPTPIHIGVVHYQRLKYMAQDKIQSRGRTGKIDRLTRQPLEGKSRGGGGRIGEQERDALTGHGAASILQDKLLINSDLTLVPFCTQCHNIASNLHNPAFGESVIGKRPYCPGCGAEAAYVCQPYATKLMIQEAQALFVKVEPELKIRVLTEWLAPRIEKVKQLSGNINDKEDAMRYLWDQYQQQENYMNDMNDMDEMDEGFSGIEILHIDDDDNRYTKDLTTEGSQIDLNAEIENFDEDFDEDEEWH